MKNLAIARAALPKSRRGSESKAAVFVEYEPRVSLAAELHSGVERAIGADRQRLAARISVPQQPGACRSGNGGHDAPYR